MNKIFLFCLIISFVLTEEEEKKKETNAFLQSLFSILVSEIGDKVIHL